MDPGPKIEKGQNSNFKIIIDRHHFWTVSNAFRLFKITNLHFTFFVVISFIYVISTTYYDYVLTQIEWGHF